MASIFKYTTIIYQEKDMKKRQKKLSECNTIPQQNQISTSLNYSIFGGRND